MNAVEIDEAVNEDPGSADVPVGTANEKANDGAGNDHPGSAGVPVGTANEEANDGAGNDVPLASHSHANEDVGVPRANEDVGVPRANEDVGVPRANEDVGVPRANEDVGAPEWYSRGYLPHRDRTHLLQSITFRLADSLPQSELKQLEQKLLLLPEIRRDIEKRKGIEQWLDAGMGCCALRNVEAAACVQNALLHFDGARYRILAWVIMPNHVHVLIDPAEPISITIGGWKSFTARWLLKHNERLGLGIPNPHHVWMREYWDRFIRDDDHLRATIDYIHRNPVKAGLCRDPGDWPWSSAGSLPGSADVPVGTENEKANEDAVRDTPLTTHSLAGEDASVPGANGDVDAPDNRPAPWHP